MQAQLAERATSSTNSEQDVRRGDVWDRLAECESGQSWSYNGGSGYDGGLQFHPATWRGFGGQEFAEFAHQATREQQIIVAQRVLESQGWRAWPACSRKLGLQVTATAWCSWPSSSAIVAARRRPRDVSTDASERRQRATSDDRP